MIPEYEERIAVRISKDKKQQIDQLIKKRKFQNKSQLIRTALREFLKDKLSESK